MLGHHCVCVRCCANAVCVCDQGICFPLTTGLRLHSWNPFFKRRASPGPVSFFVSGLLLDFLIRRFVLRVLHGLKLFGVSEFLYGVLRNPRSPWGMLNRREGDGLCVLCCFKDTFILGIDRFSRWLRVCI